jgi:hypothetical protein
MDNSTIKKSRYGDWIRALVFVIPGIVLLWVTNVLGFWWFTLLLGIVCGVFIRRGKIALVLSLLVGGLAWGGGLFYQSFSLPVVHTASLVAELAGFDATDGWVVLSSTVLLGVLLCESGTYLSLALRSLFKTEA